MKLSSAVRMITSQDEDAVKPGASPRAEGGVAQCVGGVPILFGSFRRIVASATVQFQMHAAWLETLAACTAVGCGEQGFWITWTSDSGTFSTTGPVVGPADGATINLPAKPADAHPTYTVASFHTHTPTTYRTVGRAFGPGGADFTAGNSDTSVKVARGVFGFCGDGPGNLPAGRSRVWPAAGTSRATGASDTGDDAELGRRRHHRRPQGHRGPRQLADGAYGAGHPPGWADHGRVLAQRLARHARARLRRAGRSRRRDSGRVLSMLGGN